MKKTTLLDEIMDIVARILGIYLILLLTFWFADKEKFWMLFYWGIGIVAIVIFLFILSKKQDKKRKDNLIFNKGHRRIIS